MEKGKILGYGGNSSSGRCAEAENDVLEHPKKRGTLVFYSTTA
jgi:hypothetical protein